MFHPSWAVIFLGIFLALQNAAKVQKGERCSSLPLDDKELQEGNCEQLANGTYNNYRTIKCLTDATHSAVKDCLYLWCYRIAKCFHQSRNWRWFCYWQFYWFRSTRFDITATKQVVNGTYVRNIQVRHCDKTYLNWWRSVQYIFSIKTTGYRCYSEPQIKNAPCSGKWIGPQSVDYCDYLVNGTENHWVRPYSTTGWCTSFYSCLGSQELKDRCLTEFKRFYRSYFFYNQAFKFEVSSYIPSVRIQVQYDCDHSSRFRFNIIRCESGAKNITSDDDDDDYDEDPKNEMEDYDLNTAMSSALSALDVLSNNSLEEAVAIFGDKINDYINHTSATGQDSNRSVSLQEKMENVLMATVAFEEFALQFADFHLSKSSAALYLISDKIDLQIKRAGSENKSEFYLEESKETNYMKIPSTDFQNGLSYRIVIHTISAFVWVFALVT